MSPRRMEEASVAGESPDKSKQQKSSGTVWSEGDPRLAVFREPSAGAEAGAGAAWGYGHGDGRFPHGAGAVRSR